MKNKLFTSNSTMPIVYTSRIRSHLIGYEDGNIVLYTEQNTRAQVNDEQFSYLQRFSAAVTTFVQVSVACLLTLHGH